ncbi:hypothetical protein E3Q23_03021 [Wallemia mellicola]|nr:hypothetical protein E3Q23_03021 [Wallemia mellicola]TIC10149.1 amine oxidase catalytic domain-containing protein [Wallemia mellicola]TIC52205.1 amine oxidase catalytic domain-containing protein [Wallemia mellicola]
MNLLFLTFIGISLVFALKVRQSNTYTSPIVRAPKVNPFKELSNDELTSLNDWLMDPNQSLNLKVIDQADLRDNYIDSIELWQPNKEDAIKYLDQGGPKPNRMAKVHIVNGADKPPIIKTLLVGPLPVSSDTKVENLADKIYHNPKIPWNAKTSHPAENIERSNIISKVFGAISPALNDLLGAPWSFNNYDTGFVPNNGDGSFRHPWVELMLSQNNSAMWFAYTGFFAQFDFSNQDTSEWKLLKLVYGNRKWNSTDSFMNDFESGSIRASPKVNLTDMQWALRSVKGNTRDLEELPAPRAYSPNGPRYRIDTAERYVSWLDWSFYISYSPEQGVGLYDVRFKDERIAYEITLQDAISNYGGSDPLQAYTAYLDRGYGMGTSITTMIRNYDCSHEATYLNVNYYESGNNRVKNDTICMFEHDLQKPLSRHSQSSDSGSTRGVAFEIRSIYTVGNYDYLLSFLLYPEGSIEIEVAASGYLQTTYFDPFGSSYGTRVSSTSSGSIHDHVIPFKVDLDIAGKENSIEKRQVFVSEDKFDWMDDDEPPVRQKKIKSSVMNREQDAIIDWDGNTSSLWLIGNQNSTNTYGYPRSYRIIPHSVIHNIVDGYKMERNAKFADHHAFVTVNKDNERSASSFFNAFLPQRPPVDFTKFYEDNEMIRQQDLTLWCSVGFRHIPRAEDVPNTLFIAAKSSLSFSPFNYGNETLSRDLRNSYYAVADDNGHLLAKDNGIDLEESCSMPAFNTPDRLT